MRWSPFPFTLRQLQYALAISETGSFRAAAERCRVAQPSLSAQIAELERYLGVMLFERDKRRVLTTPAGIEILERSRRALIAAQEIEEAARRHVDPLAGTLRLGVIPTVSPYLLPHAVPALRRAFPALTLAWSEEKTGDLVPRVRAGDLDAAVLAAGDEIAELDHVLLGRDPFVLVMPKGHPLARSRAPLDPAALAGVPVLLLDEGHCLRAQALDVCATSRAEELGYRATSLPTLVQMVAVGDAVTLLPRIALATEQRRADLRVRPFAEPSPARRLVLAFRRSSPLGEALRRIGEVLARALITSQA